MNGAFRVLEYTEGEWSPFAEWFDKLDAVTAARVDRYVRRLESGNFGAAKALRDGVCELRLDSYRPVGRRRQAAPNRRYRSRR